MSCALACSALLFWHCAESRSAPIRPRNTVNSTTRDSMSVVWRGGEGHTAVSHRGAGTTSDSGRGGGGGGTHCSQSQRSGYH